MRRAVINIILIASFAVLMVVIVLPFVAEMEFKQAKKLEFGYRWEKTGEKYQSAAHLNPFNASYFTGAGDSILRQSAYREDKAIWLKRAKKLYERACQLNPRYAEYWYALGKVRLVISRQKAVGSREYTIGSVVEDFRKAVDADPYNFRNNYLIGHNLLTVWGSLDEKEKEFTLDRLKYLLQLRPDYGERYVYPAIMYYAKDFSIAQEVAPDGLKGYKSLLSFIKKNRLWQYRKEVMQQVNFYRQKEEPEEFQKERLARLRQLEEIKEIYRNEVEMGRNDIEIDRKDWQGKTPNGKQSYKNGNMYWTGTVDAAVEMPQGKAKINISAKGSQADEIFPYMIVELDGAEIGERFVDSPEWKEYSFKADTEGGLKVLSITFVNDGGNKQKKEDRNLYIGEAKIVNDNGK